jgi:endonuclease/exonuclease/phosphatase family metal-dependent hydrolase
VRQVPITNGSAVEVTVIIRDRLVRVVVVDGDSNVLRSRTPMLRDVIRACADSAAAGEPIDLIAGDFNAVGRSVGFDEFPRAGFTNASAQSPGWRPTWPAWLPLYDIDHVWVGRGWVVESYEQFTNLSTDHRAQFARLRPQG